MASLITGLILGAFRLIIEIQNKVEPLTNKFLYEIATINFLHFAVFLFIISSAVLVIVSLFTEIPGEEKTAGMVYQRSSLLFEGGINKVNAAFSILLVLVLLFLWWSFR